jgi:hypothetical protein
MIEFLSDPKNIVIVCLAAVVGVFFAKQFWAIDRRVIARRKMAGRLAAKLAPYGPPLLVSGLTDYAAGDYIDLAEDVHRVLEKMCGDEKAFWAELETVFDSLLAYKLSTTDGQKYIADELAKAVPPTAVSK